MPSLADMLAQHLHDKPPAPAPHSSLAENLSQHLQPVQEPHKASVLQKLGAYAELPFDMANAAQRSRLAGHGEFGKEFRDAWQQYVHDPVAASEEYGVNSPGELQYGATHHDPLEPFGQNWARFNQKHPKETGVETFATELFNPSNIPLGVAGGALMKGAGAGLRALAAVEKPAINTVPRALLHVGDRFADIRRVAGQKGVAAMRSMLAAWSGADNSAMQDTMRIFGGLSPAEKREVIHLSQGRAPSLHVTDYEERPLTEAQAKAATLRKTAAANAGRPIVNARGSDLAQRATLLRSTLKDLDAQQKQFPGLLEETRTFDPERFFPMKGAYTDPMLNEMAEAYGEDYAKSLQDSFEDLGKQQGAGGQVNVRKQTAGVHGGHKSFATLQEAEQSGKLREDWDPAENLYSHLSRRRKNMVFERAMQALPPSLRQDITYVDAAGNVARDEQGKPLTGARFQDWLKRNPMAHESEYTAQTPPSGMVRSRDYLWRVGSPTMLESNVSEPLARFLVQSAGRADSERGGLLKALDSFNRISRAAIISNPLVHGMWNLGNNYLAAGGPISALFRQYPKALEEEAQAAGAFHGLGSTSSFLGGNAAHLATTPLKYLGPKEWLDKVSQHAWNFNQKLTFDVMERRYALALFSRLRSEGLGPGKAAEQVRRALGDYANVAPNDPLNRPFFFYPWLKSNTQFWLGRAAHAPQYVNAPVQGIHRTNEVAQDPNLDAKFPTADFTLYDGNGRYWSVPHPARILMDLAMGFPGLYKIALSHLNPGMSALADVAHTMSTDHPQSDDPRVVFQRSAPPIEQAKQAGSYLLNKTPVPMLQQFKGLPSWIQGLRQYGFTPSDILGMTGGFTYSRQDPASAAALWDAFKTYQVAAGAAQSDADKQQAWSEYQAEVQSILQNAGH